MDCEKDIPEKRIFHDWTLSRMKHLWFWKGQVVCRMVGHRVPKYANRPVCGHCGIALEEIYGLAFYNHFRVIPEESENAKMRAAIIACRDSDDAGEKYTAPTADAAVALMNLFKLVD